MRTRLVEQARDGDDVAFAELVDLDGDLCYAIAFRILRDPERAQDAVQQAFLLAWRELPRLRDPERFGPWLHRLLVNACYEELRRHRRWITRITVLPVDGPSEPDPMVSVDDRDALDRAFRAPVAAASRGLRPAPPRRASRWRRSPTSSALPLGTVKSRLHYATRQSTQRASNVSSSAGSILCDAARRAASRGDR